MSDRPLLTAAGILAVAWGLAVLLEPQLAGVVETDYLFVKLVGVLALVQALRAVQARRDAEVEQAETPDPETTVTLPTPGEELDRRIAETHEGPRQARFQSRKRVRRELEDAAADAIAQRENCTTEEAQAKLEAGEWTDDPYAAAFVGGPTPPRRSWREWVRQSFSSESTFQRRARLTADAVARYVEGDR